MVRETCGIGSAFCKKGNKSVIELANNTRGYWHWGKSYRGLIIFKGAYRLIDKCLWM